MLLAVVGGLAALIVLASAVTAGAFFLLKGRGKKVVVHGFRLAEGSVCIRQDRWRRPF